MEIEIHQAAGGGGDEHQICRIHICKNVSGANQLQYCEHHYKFFTSIRNTSSMNSNKRKYLTKKNMEEMEMELLPDEHFCSHTAGTYTSGVYRCRNFRMGHGAAAEDHRVPKSKFCEKHYNYYSNYNKKRKLLKKKSGDGEVAGCSPRDSNCSKLKEHDRSLDLTGIQPPTTDIEGGGSANVMAKRKNAERTEWSGEVDFTDFVIEEPSLITSNEMKNNKEMEKKKLPTNEQFCCVGTRTWRCKNVRMSNGGAADDASVPKTKYCEKHYNYHSKKNKNRKNKKRIGDGEGAGAGCTPATGLVEEINCSKPGEKVTEEVHDAEIRKLGATGHSTSDRIGRKRENVEIAEKSGQPESYKGLGETVVELEHYKTDRIGRKRENVERAEASEQPASLKGIGKTVVELESLEHYKTKCFELSAELEKKKVEYTTLKVKLLGVVETKKTFEDAAEYWRKMYSDLESRVLRVEKENSTRRCFFTKLDGLLPRHGKESSLLRCKELRNSEETESEAWGTQNEVIQSGEKHNWCNHNAETSSGGRKGSHAFGNHEHHDSESEFHYYSAVNISSGSVRISSGGEKVEEGKGWGCLEERPSQHGSSSQNHLEMSTKAFVNLVSDDDSVGILGESEDFDYSTDSEGSLGTLMDMLTMKYRNMNEDKEIKWKIETDMLSSFEEDPELCLKAVCALYRQQICENEISDKGLFHNSDALSCTTLAKFLMGKDCKSDLTKSVKELEILDSNAVEDCKRLARRYSTQLFSIYQNGKDPFFLPSTTASHGDETAK